MIESIGISQPVEVESLDFEPESNFQWKITYSRYVLYLALAANLLVGCGSSDPNNYLTEQTPVDDIESLEVGLGFDFDTSQTEPSVEQASAIVGMLSFLSENRIMLDTIPDGCDPEGVGVKTVYTSESRNGFKLGGVSPVDNLLLIATKREVDEGSELFISEQKLASTAAHELYHLTCEANREYRAYDTPILLDNGITLWGEAGSLLFITDPVIEGKEEDDYGRLLFYGQEIGATLYGTYSLKRLNGELSPLTINDLDSGGSYFSDVVSMYELVKDSGRLADADEASKFQLFAEIYIVLNSIDGGGLTTFIQSLGLSSEEEALFLRTIGERAVEFAERSKE